MKGELTNIVKVAFTYIATIIGAGFASGQEIVQFFSAYYRGGFYGIILAGVLFSAIGCIVLDKVYTERIRNYDEFLFPAAGYYLGRVMEIVVTLFMFSLFSVMVAGIINILNSRLGVPHAVSAFMTAVACAIFITKGIRGISSLSMVVTPMLIAGMLLVGFYIIACKDAYVFSISGTLGISAALKAVTQNWFFSSLLYVSYNSIISVVVMCGMLPYLKTRRTGLAGGFIGGCLLCAIAIVLNTVLSLFHPGYLSDELPVLGIVGKYNSMVNFIYMLALWLAMFISGVMAGYGFVSRVNRYFHINMKVLAAASCGIAAALSGIGFSNLIASLYPLFGYAGLFMVFMILAMGARSLLAKNVNK